VITNHEHIIFYSAGINYILKCIKKEKKVFFKKIALIFQSIYSVFTVILI